MTAGETIFKILKFIFLIALLAALAYLSYFVYLNYPRAAQTFNTGSYNPGLNAPVNASNEVTQFYPNMRFNHNKITYFILDCDTTKTARLSRAFNIIETDTGIISFYKTDNEEEADIHVGCSANAFEKEKNTFIAGEGGPTSFIDLKPYPIIIKGKVMLYKEESCDYPITELHELFHVFGFDHINRSKTIMYPYVDCEQRIDPEMINLLKTLYSVEPKAELYFTNLSAVKKGIYLDYDLQVNNDGLIMAKNVKLEIYSGNQLIESSPLKDLDYGTGQHTWVKNMKLPSLNVNKLTFKITTDTSEFNTQNNIIEVAI